MRKRQSLILFMAAMPAAAALAQPVSFPGAVGFGDTTTGGRTGSIYVVTTLADSGAGSFRDAVSQSNRIIVFDVSGAINLLSAVTGKSNLTILGQTAPGQGIAFQGYEVSFSDQSNDLIQYLRFREGSTDPSEKASLNLGDLNGGIIDHVSAEFSQYDNIDAVGSNSAANNLTYSNDLIADPIKAQQLNLHEEGNQTTYINNVFANGHGRTPLAKSNSQYVNNVVYNYGYGFTTGDSSGAFKYDILNNYFITGPSTSDPSDAFYQLDSNQSAYSSGNLLDSNKDGTLNGSAVSPSGLVTLTSEWSPATQYLPTLSTAAAYAFDVAHAGDSLQRDQVDSQIISQVQSLGTAGSIYNGQDDDGLSNNGFGTIPTATLITMPATTLDSVPFAWLTTHGITSTTDATQLTLLNPLGYTMIEEYAQQVGDEYASQTAISGDWAAASWSSTTPGVYDHALIRGNGTVNGAVTIGNSDSDNAFTVSIGGNGPASPGESLAVSGGSLVVQDTIYVGDQNNGTLTISGGTVRATNIQLGNTVYDSSGNPTNYTGTFNFNGGTLLLMNQIVQGVGTPGSWTSGAVWNWSGGTLEPLAAVTVNIPATLGSGGAIVNSNGFNDTFSGALGGTGAFTKTGTGIVTLSATNTYGGGTNINGGELSIASDANIGGSTSAINFNGGLLQVTGTALTNIDAHAVNWSSFNGGFDIASASNTFTVSENISGSGSMSVNGSGILYLTGNNSYTGGTFLNGGFLEIASTASLGGISAPLNFNGGSLYVTGTSVTTIDSYDVNWSSFNGGFNIASAANTFSIGQVLGGSGSLTKSGPGVLLLNAANTFTGTTTITGGTLRLGNALALQDSSVSLTTSGVTLDLNGFNATFGGLSGNQGLDLKGTTLTVGGNNASTAYSGVISDSMPGGTAGMLIKTGSGTWTLSGSSTFTGPLEVSKGIITVATLANGGTASPWGKASNLPANLILNGGTLQYTGSSSTGIDRLFTLTANGGTLDGAASAGFQLTNSGSVAVSGNGSRTLTLAGTGTNNAFSFALGDPTSGVGSTSLTMNGTGRWILNGVGALTYSGTTTVAAGTLLDLNKANVLPFGAGKGNLSIASGATFEMNGNSNNINALVGAGTMDNRSGTAVLTLGNGDATGTFSGAITAAGGALSVVKTGAGTQSLTGANTYVGATTVSSGTLELASPGSLTSTALSVSTGAVLNIDSGTTIPAATVLTDNGTTNLVSPTKTIVTLNGTGTLNLNPTVLTITAGGSFSGVIEGGGGPIVGNGSLVLSGVNTYTGSTAVNIGSLEIASPGSLVSTTVSTLPSTLLTVDSGAALSASTNLTLGGVATFKNATQTIATLNGAGTVNLTSNALTITGGGSFTGAIAGTGSLTIPSGALKLSGVNTFSGSTSINGGSLELASPGTLADTTIGIAASAQLTVDSGAGLSPSNNLTDNGTASFANATQTIATLNGAGTLNLNPTILTITGGGTFSGGVAGTGAVTIAGGTYKLSGADTFTGATKVTAGSLEIASPGSLTDVAVTTSGTGLLTVDSGATLSPSTQLADGGTATFNSTAQTIATLNGAGTLNLNPTTLTITGSGTFSGPINGTGNITAAGSTLTLSGSSGYSGSTSVTAGTLTLDYNGASQSSNLTAAPGTNLNINQPLATTATLNANGNVNFGQNHSTGILYRTVTAVNIGGAGIVAIASPSAPANRTALATSALNITNGGTLNLTGNDLIVHGGVPGTIFDEIQSGLAGGGGITTSSASSTTTLGMEWNNDGSNNVLTGTFDGQPAIDTDVLVKYTYFGDADLSGTVNALDYEAIDNGFNSLTTADPLSGWNNGDFNYDGQINGDDYTLIDNAFNSQAGVSFASLSTQPTEMIATATSQIAAVPEPGTLALLTVGGALLARRRRKSSRLC